MTGPVAFVVRRRYGPGSYPSDVRLGVRWYDLRQGVHLMAGTVPEVVGGSNAVALGRPPHGAGRDGAAIDRRLDR